MSTARGNRTVLMLAACTTGGRQWTGDTVVEVTAEACIAAATTTDAGTYFRAIQCKAAMLELAQLIAATDDAMLSTGWPWSQ